MAVPVAVVVQIARAVLEILAEAGMLDLLLDEFTKWAKSTAGEWDDIIVRVLRDLAHRAAKGEV